MGPHGFRTEKDIQQIKTVNDGISGWGPEDLHNTPPCLGYQMMKITDEPDQIETMWGWDVWKWPFGRWGMDLYGFRIEKDIQQIKKVNDGISGWGPDLHNTHA